MNSLGDVMEVSGVRGERGWEVISIGIHVGEVSQEVGCWVVGVIGVVMECLMEGEWDGMGVQEWYCVLQGRGEHGWEEGVVCLGCMADGSGTYGCGMVQGLGRECVVGAGVGGRGWLVCCLQGIWEGNNGWVCGRGVLGVRCGVVVREGPACVWG